MTTETQDTTAKKLSKKEIAEARMAANVQAVEAMLEADHDSGNVTGGKEAFGLVVASNGLDMDTVKAVDSAKAEFAAVGAKVLHNLAKTGFRANPELQSFSVSLPMNGRDHLDIAANRDGTTDLRMVQHSTNTNAGVLKETCSDFAAAMAIFEAQESSREEAKSKA